jgi:hypothetical protein
MLLGVDSEGLNMNWVNSRGGPLICAEEHVAVQWMGVDGLSASGASQRNDYERACGTRQYLQAITCAAGFVLVLGDEPLQSSFFRADGGELAIARWVYAPPHDDVETYLTAPAAGNGDLAPAIPFNVTQGPLLLFDSALPGTEVLEQCLKANVRSGSYRVTTEKRQLSRKFSFIVHRLSTE